MQTTTRHRIARIAAVAGVGMVALTGCSDLSNVIDDGAQSTSSPAATYGSSAGGKYQRDAFGPAWADVDGNGCDTRNDILARDLTDVTYKAGDDCVVASGTLHDPYTGKVIEFKRGRGTSKAVQIDHVVALSDAWNDGADAWSDAKREQFANDPDNLLAVDGPANNAKRDKDPSQWLPSNTSYQCDYTKHYIEVATRYELNIPDAVRDTEARVCG